MNLLALFPIADIRSYAQQYLDLHGLKTVSLSDPGFVSFVQDCDREASWTPEWTSDTDPCGERQIELRNHDRAVRHAHPMEEELERQHDMNFADEMARLDGAAA